MKKDQIEIGGNYMAKVSDKVVPVRIDAVNSHGGWDATNLMTNKKVRIKSAQRLRGPAPRKADGKGDKKPTATPEVPATAAKPPAKGRTKAKSAPTANPAEKPAKAKKASGLDAAAQVLKEAGQPMKCGDLVKTILARGLWTTNGQTPEATMNAAIHKEIKAKGGASRFIKTERGMFKFNG